MPDLFWPAIAVIVCVIIAGTGAILAWRADGKNPKQTRIKKKIEDVTLPDVDESAIGFSGVPNEANDPDNPSD